MRLRLRIERNALPPTQAIWPVKDRKSTTAQLVQHVNEVFPLEGDTWGLEDYSISVGGYECLHYHELEAVCRDEDEVVIRPLQYAEVRARTLTGRDQIAADGRHLVDGIPFGRPCLKGPVRPEVRIPPRKKRKLLHGAEEDEEAAPLMLTEHGEELDNDEDDEDDDEDFEVAAKEDDTSSAVSTSESESDESLESESDDSDTSSSESSSEDTSDSDSDESWNGIPSSTPATPNLKTPVTLVNGITDDTNINTSVGSKRKRESDDQHHESEKGHEAKAVKIDKNAPGEGSPLTKQRNDRRRNAKKLKHLKKLHVLPQEATMDDLREWQNNNPDFQLSGADGNIVTLEPKSGQYSEAATMQLGTGLPQVEVDAEKPVMLPESGEEVLGHPPPVEQQPLPPAQKRSKKAKKSTEAMELVNEDLNEQREKLLSAIASGGVDVSGGTRKKRTRLQKSLDEGEDDSEPPEEIKYKQQPAAPAPHEQVVIADQVIDRDNLMVPPSVSRRSQLDLAGSKRLLFGSLGVRVPKTQEEKDRVQKKLAERPKRNAFSADQGSSFLDSSLVDGTSAAAPDAAETEEDPDAWRDKIDLTAVECCNEGITLSTPPFPFYQRWDPQQRKKKAGRRVSDTYMEHTAKRRRARNNADHIESYDKYNTNGGGDALGYDDVGGEDDEYWEEGALLNGEYDEEEIDDGFPQLPADLKDLPPVQEAEALKEDFIVFTELACDESTEWQPKTVTRTAKILEAPSSVDSGSKQWTIELAARDLKPKFFDDQGNRVYSKFEMPDEDGEDEGRREVSWPELGIVRLLFRPTVEVDGQS